VTDRYSPAVTAHYAAYRPPLHDRLLARVLGDRDRHQTLARTLDDTDPFPGLQARLAAEGTPRSVGATLFWSTYRRVAA
jgi:hypothetical protein